MSKPKTTTERVTEFRQRMREQGLKEVRNLWAYPEDFGQIKIYVAKLNRRRSKEN